MKTATSITQLFPKSMPNGNTIHMVEHYEVGKLCRVPNYGMEEVEYINILTDTSTLIGEVVFKDYGMIWITSHIAEIRFERPEYKDILKERKKKKKDGKV